MEKIVDAGGSVGFFPSVGEIRLVIGTDDAGVGGDDQPTVGIQCLGKLLEREVAGPFVIVRVTGDRNFAVAFLTNGDASGHEVADVAFGVGVDGILAGTPDIFHDVAKFAPIFRFGEPVVSVAEAAGFEGGPTEGVWLVAFLIDDWPMASDNYFQMFVLLAFNPDDFIESLRLHPFSID